AEPDNEVRYAGEIIASVAATSEEAAREALTKIQVQYQVLPHLVDDTDATKSDGREQGEDKPDAAAVDAAISGAEVKVSGKYGLACITHACHESHGQVCEFGADGNLYVWPSTQNVSAYAGGLKDASGLAVNQIFVDCQYMGGGFGSKFDSGRWGAISVRISKETGKPVKLMLERDQELLIGGNRPSAYADVTVGATKDGTISVWSSNAWGSGGMGGAGRLGVPYVFTKIPNVRTLSKGVRTNRRGAVAWRAPGHPQACLITMAAIADLAAELKMDELEFFLKNVALTDRPEVYTEELKIAADMIGYKDKAHLRSNPTPGTLKRGLGIGIHTWGGIGNDSQTEVVINPDGAVSVSIGTQDLGVGTRTAVAIVAAETLGLPLDKVQANIGKNSYPPSGASGGSTTIGGVSASTRDASTIALNALLEKVAPVLGVTVDELEARDGKIQVAATPSKSLPWAKACSLLGQMPISGRGENKRGKGVSDGTILDDQGVGGVQIADVSVDVETGQVFINEFVAVQDCGRIVDLLTAESQVYGALIMGVTYALYEECIYDNITGRMLNADLEFYRLATLADVGKLKVHMMTGPGYDTRGVIGLGEPPVIAPGAAISNAVANAIGVRVPTLPLTPEKVLAALEQGGKLA
ncbi:MAG TPA: xanthine dehydrogenase family protein molybdopterin-binding subunit, partial [Candidatus Hydrogenedentes bacterium]|nr:xanthine dehydrogenase family protein molybdopterin-binding subunit [Candidatus Hydrogenedentota bacterium]